MKGRLLTTPYEKDDQRRYIEEVTVREKKTNASKERLEMSYKEALKDKEDEVSKKHAAGGSVVEWLGH